MDFSSFNGFWGSRLGVRKSNNLYLAILANFAGNLKEFQTFWDFLTK